MVLQVGRGKLTDPLKYEDWIDDKTRILKECDPHLDLMLFPDDDIEVKKELCKVAHFYIDSTTRHLVL